MKGFSRKLFYLAVFTMFFHATPGFADNPVLKVSTDPWEPWALGTEGKEATGGIAVEMTRDLFKRLDTPVEIVIYPYERCINQMKTGERDVLLMVKKTPEREQFMLFSDVAAEDPQLLYYATDKRKDFSWSEFKDLSGYTVGVVRGFNYGEFDKAADAAGIKKEAVSDDTQNISKLLAGRVDFIILNRSTAKFYFDQHKDQVGKFKAASKPISNAQFHFAVSKKGKAVDYVDRINRVLKAMRADKSWDKYMGILN